MPYDYVTSKDVGDFVDAFYAKGYRGNDLKSITKRASDELEYRRFSQESAKGIVPTYLKGAIAAAPRLASETMRGAPAFIPGESFVDELLRAGAEKTEALVPKLWERESYEAAEEGQWLGRKGAALVGQHTPLVMGMGLAGKVGGIAGPVGEVGAQYGSMALLESGGFTSATDDLGIDRDIQEKWARGYGSVSGAIEYLQVLMILNPYARGAKAGAKAVSKVGKRALTKHILPFLKGAGKEVGTAALEGVEEVMQGALFNQMLDNAVAEQNQRNRQRGLPAISQDEITGLKENLARGFEHGFGVAMIMRGPGVMYRGYKGLETKAVVRAATKEVEAAKQAMKEGVSFEEFIGKRGEKFVNPAMIDQLFSTDIKREAGKTLTQEEWERRIDLVPEDDSRVTVQGKEYIVPGLTTSARWKDIDLERADGKEKTFAELRQELKDRYAQYLGETPEGTRLVQSENDRIYAGSTLVPLTLIPRVKTKKPVKPRGWKEIRSGQSFTANLIETGGFGIPLGELAVRGGLTEKERAGFIGRVFSNRELGLKRETPPAKTQVRLENAYVAPAGTTMEKILKDLGGEEVRQRALEDGATEREAIQMGFNAVQLALAQQGYDGIIVKAKKIRALTQRTDETKAEFLARKKEARALRKKRGKPSLKEGPSFAVVFDNTLLPPTLQSLIPDFPVVAEAVRELIRPSYPAVEIVQPVANRADPTEIRQEEYVERTLREFIERMPTPFITWLTGLEDKVRNKGLVEAAWQQLEEERTKSDPDPTLANVTRDQFLDFVEQLQKGAKVAIEKGVKDKQALALPPEMSRFFMAAERRAIYQTMVFKALSPVVGDQIATVLSRYANLRDYLKFEDVLPRDQFQKFRDNMEGQLRNMLRDNHAHMAKVSDAQVTADIQKISNIAPIQLIDGTNLDPALTEDPKAMPWITRVWSRWAAMFPALERLANRYNLRIMELDRSLYFAHKLERKTLLLFRLVLRSLWKNVPRSLRTGEAGKRMSELVHWLSTDTESQQELADLLGVDNDINLLVDRVAEKSTLKDKGEIERIARGMSGERAEIFRWFGRNGTIDPNKVRAKYVQVVRTFRDEEGFDSEKLFGKWVQEKRKVKGHTSGLSKFSDLEVENLIELADSLTSWENRGLIVPGKKVPNYEYVRRVDRDMLKDLGMLTDIRDIDDIYIRAMVRKKIFGPLVPATLNMIQNSLSIIKSTNVEDWKVAQKIFSNYLETIMGIPDSGSAALKTLDVSPISNTAARITNKAINFFNNTLAKNLPDSWKIQSLIEDDVLTGQEVMQLGITAMYATTLGFPFNVVAPLKNLTQSFMAIPAVGMKTWLKGLNALATEPKVMMEVIGEIDPRPEQSMYEEGTFGGKRGRWAASAQVFMSLFRGSDMFNVYTTAASGIIAWRRVEKILVNNPTAEGVNPQVMIDALFDQKDPKLDDQKVMDKSVPTKLKFNKTISKSVALDVVDLIKNGRAEDARNLYIQYLVNLSQWRYGAGGTPGYLRHAAARSMLMYTSWSMNYVDFVSRIFTKPGLIPRYAIAGGMQFLACSIFLGMGINTVEWIWFGPLPDDLKPTGPIAQFAQRLLAIITGGGEALVSSVLPGVDKKQRAKYWGRVKRNIRDLVDAKILDTRVLEYLD